MRTPHCLILILLLSISSTLSGQNEMTKFFPGKILSSLGTWDETCNGPSSTISFILPAGPNYDITSINFGYTYQADVGFMPTSQKSQLYFENLGLSSPVYTGTIEDAGAAEFYEENGFTDFNDSFCGNDTLNFQLRLWRDEGTVFCAEDQNVSMNTFYVTLYFSDAYSAKVTIGDSTKETVLEVFGNIKISDIPGVDAEPGVMAFDPSTNEFRGYDGSEWRSFTNHTQLEDQDMDTKITVEESLDEDVVKIYNEGVHYFSFDQGRIDVLNNGNSVHLGNQAGKMESGSALGNVAIGDSALMNSTSKKGLVAIGSKALKNNGTAGSFELNGSHNSAIGYESMEDNTSGYKNTALGYRSLSSNTIGNFNVAMGSSTLQNNINGFGNVGVGLNALADNLSGYQNVGVGRSALENNNNGINNIGVGSFSLFVNNSGENNIAIGTGALQSSTVQSNNMAIGFKALNLNGSGLSDPSQGTQNTAVGHESQSTATQGNNNTSLGYYTLKDNTANQNTAIGALSLVSNVAGFDNTAVGFESLKSNVSGNRNTALGSKALSQVTGSFNTAVGTEGMQNLVSGNNNVAVGYRSMVNSNNVDYNTAIGNYTLTNNIGFYNTALGYGALFVNTSGFENTNVGVNSGSANTDGNRNVGLGYQSLFTNQSTDELTAIGYQALNLNTSGFGNTGVGFIVLKNNVSGDQNTAIGHSALADNTANMNTAIGYHSLKDNSTGNNNTAVGNKSLFMNINGFNNVGVGSDALEANISGFRNVAIGSSAMENLTSGEGNIAIGSLSYSETGTHDVCTSIGYQADGGRTNSIALGYASALTANNQVRIGNAFHSSIGGFANWSNVSDGRFKKDIKSDVKGLAFIKQLRPVTYHYNMAAIKDFHDKNDLAFPDKSILGSRAESKLISGFIAQEVEQAARGLGYDFSGVDRPEEDGSYYGLRYAEFVVPLVKAVQEMDEKIEGYEEVIRLLKEQNAGMEARLSKLENRE